jgi:hypothetical protein
LVLVRIHHFEFHKFDEPLIFLEKSCGKLIKNTQEVQFQNIRRNDLEINEEDNKQNIPSIDYIPSISIAMHQYFSQVAMSLQTANVQPRIISNVSSTMRFMDMGYMRQGEVT